MQRDCRLIIYKEGIMEENTTLKSIGERIRIARKAKGLNQQQLADAIGKSIRAVQMYEKGETDLNILLYGTNTRIFFFCCSLLFPACSIRFWTMCLSDSDILSVKILPL